MTEVPDRYEVYLNVGDMVRVILPSSEVCMSMKVARKPMRAQVILEGSSIMVQLYSDSGRPFSLPIFPNEAGFFTDNDGRLYVPTRSLAPPLRLRLFIPKPGSALATQIAPGSAIVGRETD